MPEVPFFHRKTKPSSRNFLDQENIPLPEKLTLVDLFPHTYKQHVTREDAPRFGKAVVRRFFQKQSEEPLKKTTVKSLRQWAGFTLGTLAFWALPWPSLAADVSSVPITTLRSAASASPYFVLNLPDSAKSYKTLAQVAGNSLAQTALLPITLTKYAMWRRKKFRLQRKKSEEALVKLATEDLDTPLLKLQKIARRKTRDEIEKRIQENKTNQFIAQNGETIKKVAELLPSITEEERVNLVITEGKIARRKAIRQGVLLFGATIAIPALLFHFATSLPTEFTQQFPQQVPLIAASIGSLLARRGLVRIIDSSKFVGTIYTKNQIGTKLLSQS